MYASGVTLSYLVSGLGYSYSVLVFAVPEYWISGTRTLLVLVSSKVIVLVLVLVLVGKYSGTLTSTGTSTDILWYICGVRVKPSYLWNKQFDLPWRKISIFIYSVTICIYGTWDVIANSITSFNSIIIEKLTELLLWCLCLLLSFFHVHFPIQILVNVWKFLLLTLKNTLVSTHFMILRNFCFLFLNCQQIVIVSHDSQYITIRTLKCYCTKWHSWSFVPGL